MIEHPSRTTIKLDIALELVTLPVIDSEKTLKTITYVG